MTADVLDLLDVHWDLTSQGQKYDAILPASALQILHRNKVFDQQPLFRYGERDLHWVSQTPWTFQCRCNISPQFLENRNVHLILGGLDTIAEVLVNGISVLEADNAFRRYQVAIRQHLQQGANQLQIVIQAASETARRRWANYPYNIPAIQSTPESVFGPGNEERYNFVRKPACDFGWDWGPSFSGAAIWGPVQLIGYSYSYLTGVNVRQKKGLHDGACLTINCQLQSTVAGAAGTVTAELPGLKCGTQQHIVLQAEGLQEVSVQVELPSDAALWWPRGYGPQTLHDLIVTFHADRATDSRSNPCEEEAHSSKEGNRGDANSNTKSADKRTSEIRKRIGLKTVELITKPLPEGGGVGETFSFSVNDVPVWIKGSNVIPSSIHVNDETPEQQRSLVAAAAASHQNTLRVWGGGRYPSGAFMEACDEAGVLVWLELAFACALYPADSAFIGNVTEEVRQQMFRLQGHACVLVLGGNNEVENSFDWFSDTSAANPSLYAVDFSRLFVDAIRPVIDETGPDIYVDTSPSNGVWSTEPFVKRWNATADNKAGVNDPRWGDVHFYNYPADGFDPETYPRAKFVSEFGWQSWPSWPGLKTAIDPKQDCGWNSPMSLYRQRHPDGQDELKQQICCHFPVGDALEHTERGFRRWIYLTQLHQAMAYDTAIRYWRRIKYEPDACTMGSLYWQLNDIWEGASWSSLNHDGSWKLLHYVITRAYAPLVVAPHTDKDGKLVVHVVSDSMHPLQGNLQLEVIPWAATLEEDCRATHVPFHVEPRGVSLVGQWGKTDFDWPPDTDLTPADVFVRVTAVAHGSTEGAEEQQVGQPYTSTAEVYFTELKDARLKHPRLTVGNFQRLSPTQVQFEVRTDVIAVGVALESELPGHFSDNAVLVLPWRATVLSFTSAADAVSVAPLRDGLSMQTLALK